MPSNRVKRLLRRIENLRGRKKQKISGSDDEGDKGSSNAWTPKSLGDYPSTNIYNSSSRSPPAELFRKDLISAMKLPDNEPLVTDEYWFISDHWKQEWERGVQVPVNPEALPGSNVRTMRKKDRTAEFKLPKKLVRLTHDDFFSNEIHQMSNCSSLAEKVCRYDLDDCDLRWLEATNNQRRLMDLPPIEEDAIEKIVEELETRCCSSMQEAIHSEAVLGIEYDEDVICDVCRSPDSEDGNEMVFCDSCDICVHQACYGITTIPEGSWLCRTCSLSIKKPSCVLCPNKGGAMKCTRTGQKWAHVSCALWIPEVSIGCVEKMEPITKIGLIPPSRWALVCCICRDRTGACIQCTVKSCKTAYHVTCGFKSGLEMQAIFEDESDDEGVKLKSYCPKHSKDKESSVSSDTEDEDDKEGSSSSSKKEKVSSEEKANARAKRLRQIESSFFKYVKVEDVAKAVHSTIDVVQFVYHYWKLKRRAGFNAPLLAPSANENDLLSQGQEDHLYSRMKMFVHLRQDLERVRNLCYMVSRREKLSRSWTRMREQIFQKQAAVMADPSLRLTDNEKRSVVHACHSGNIYDRLYSSDMSCCASSPSSSLQMLAKSETIELTSENGSKAKRSGSTGGERLPNPYARLYNNLMGVHSRTRRRSGGSLDSDREGVRCKSSEELKMADSGPLEKLLEVAAVSHKEKVDERLKCDKPTISRQSPQHYTRSASHKVEVNDVDFGSDQSRDVRKNCVVTAATSRSSRSRDNEESTTCAELAKVDSKYLSAKENMERLALDGPEIRPNSSKSDWKSEEDDADSHRRHHRHKKSKQRFRNLRSPSNKTPPRESLGSSTTTTPAKSSVPQSPTLDTQTSPFRDKLRQETAKIRESLFSTSSLKSSLAGYRIPKKTRNDSESDVKIEDGSELVAVTATATSSTASTTVTTISTTAKAISANNEQEQQQLQTTTIHDVKSHQQQQHQPYKNHWRETGNNVINSGNPLQLQTQRWNCNPRPAPLLPTPPMMPRMPLPQYTDRRLTRRDRTTIYDPSSSIGPSLNGGRDECAGRLVIKLRKDPNYPESHRWRHDGEVVCNKNKNNSSVYDYECEPNHDSSPPPPQPPSSSSSRHVRLKLNATRFDGHHASMDPRLRGSVSPAGMTSNNCRSDPRAFNKNRSSSAANNNNNTYSMRSRTSLAEHNNFS